METSSYPEGNNGMMYSFENRPLEFKPESFSEGSYNRLKVDSNNDVNRLRTNKIVRKRSQKDNSTD
jgi:hypothetical protein